MVVVCVEVGCGEGVWVGLGGMLVVWGDALPVYVSLYLGCLAVPPKDQKTNKKEHHHTPHPPLSPKKPKQHRTTTNTMVTKI